MCESVVGVATATTRQIAGIMSGGPLEAGGVNGPAGNDAAEVIETLGIVSVVWLPHRVSAPEAVRAVAARNMRIATRRPGTAILRLCAPCELCGQARYSDINANVHTDPPAGTLADANRLARPPTPETTVTY